MSEPEAPKRPRVLLIGWDAADWRIIHPLIDAGKLPALEALLDAGVMGNLATLHPVLSPMLWTSIATGVRPHKHGILGFTEPQPDGSGVRPVSGLSRRVKAVWNMLEQSGYRCNVVGWWPSHPVEPISGAMVSNHYQRAVAPLERGWPMAPGTVHPPELADELAACRFHPDELTAEDILPFVPRAAEVDQSKDLRIASLAKILCECTSIHSAATWLMDETEWDFMAVYYDAIDHFCHAFMRYHPPRRPFVPERDFELYRGVVEAGYRYHDLMLATLLAKAGDDTTVIIVSDHGFHPDHLRPESVPLEPAGPAVEHRDLGIIALRGPQIRRDEMIHGASLLDVTPTILTLFGLPVGEDMDGKPLLAAFEKTPEVERVTSWEEIEGEDGSHPADRRENPVDAREALQQLVDLGYVEPPSDNAAEAATRTERELRFNCARSYMDAAQHAEAVPILEALRESEPDELRFGLQLCMCYRALGQTPALRALVEEMTQRRRAESVRARGELDRLAEERRADDDEPTAAKQRRLAKLAESAHLDEAALDFLMGFALSTDDPTRALACLRRAEQAKAHRPVLHIQIGETYLQMRRWPDAERSFERASEIDPENPHAQLGLARSALPRRQNRKAAEYALRAVSLLYQYPMAHYCLGVALHRMGRVERAVEALQVAVDQNPNFPEAHERLARLLRNRLGDPERAEVHERVATAIRYGLRDESAPDEVRVAAPARDPAQPEVRGLDPHDAITVVSGLPRSGTSLMMQMLCAGGLDALQDDERAADDDNPRGYFELARVKALQRDASWIDEARGRVVKIVAPLLAHLPRDLPYQVIFMDRDLDEVLASQARMLERSGRAGANLERDRLATAFEREIERARAWLERAGIPTCRVPYAETVATPHDTAKRLAAFFGTPLDVDAMAAAVDPELYRQRSRRG